MQLYLAEIYDSEVVILDHDILKLQIAVVDLQVIEFFEYIEEVTEIG